jgi:YbgC/YbaW family acyl-CoA thioester hydrolase
MNQHLESFYTVRFNDCDPFRHLNNARYIDYFLNAREDHLRDYYQFDLASVYKKGMGWVVMQHDITYLRPASYNEKVCICTGLLDAGNEHLLVEMLMMDEKQSQIKSLMHTRFIPISLSTGKREPHTPEFMEFIADKALPGINGNTTTVKERIEYWQKIIKPVQPA